MTGTTQTPEQLIKQAYIVSAHARIAALKLHVGDQTSTNNLTQRRGTGLVDRFGQPLPAGTSSTAVDATNTIYGNNVEFRGLNTDGDAVVKYSGREYVVPYTYLNGPRQEERQRANLKLNEGYTGTVLGDGSTIAVGCQRFKTEKVRELLALADKTIATVKSEAKREFPPLTTAPTATYVPPAPKAAKAAKKAPAKKATKAVKTTGRNR